MKKFNLILTAISAVLILIMGCRKTPDFTMQDLTFSIPENSISGTILGKISTDYLPNDAVTDFTILSGNTNDAFRIDSAGNVIVSNSLALDCESITRFTLPVKAMTQTGKSATFTLTVNVSDVVPPSNGLILYLPFDGNLTDYSDSSNNGIDFGSSGYGAGKWGQAMIFDGKNDYVMLNHTLPSSAGLSFSFWIKSEGANGSENNGAIISKYSMSGYGRNILIGSFGSGTANTDNRLWVSFYPYGNSSAEHDMTKSYLTVEELSVYPNVNLWTITNPTRLTLSTWTHCIVNMTNTSLEIYLDGVLCTKKTREYSSYNNTLESTFIGNNLWGGDGTNNHFHGMLDELRVYNRSLSAEEIKTLYTEK